MQEAERESVWGLPSARLGKSLICQDQGDKIPSCQCSVRGRVPAHSSRERVHLQKEMNVVVSVKETEGSL